MTEKTEMEDSIAAPASPQASPSARLPVRQLGIPVADLARAARREVDAIIKEAKGNRVEAIKIGIRRLQAAGLISDHDVLLMVKAFEAASPSMHTTSQPVEDLEDIYHKALLDPEASDVAVSFIEVIYSRREDNEVIALILMGYLLGLGLGAVIPGVGSGVGGIIGGIVGWVAGVCLAD